MNLVVVILGAVVLAVVGIVAFNIFVPPAPSSLFSSPTPGYLANPVGGSAVVRYTDLDEAARACLETPGCFGLTKQATGQITMRSGTSILPSPSGEVSYLPKPQS